MRLLLILLTLIHVKVRGSLTGVIVQILPGDPEKITSLCEVERRGDTLIVDLGNFVNPLYPVSKPEMVVFYPDSSVLDIDLVLNFGKVLCDFSHGFVRRNFMDLRFSEAEMIYSIPCSGENEIYCFLSKLSIVNAENLIGGTTIYMDGGKCEVLFSGNGGGKFSIDAKGTGILISPSEALSFSIRGIFNIVRKKRDFLSSPCPEVNIRGSFNIIKIE